VSAARTLVALAALLALLAAGGADGQPRPVVPGARVYLVPVGQLPEQWVGDLVGYYRTKLKLVLQPLPPLPSSQVITTFLDTLYAPPTGMTVITGAVLSIVYTFVFTASVFPAPSIAKYFNVVVWVMLRALEYVLDDVVGVVPLVV